MDTSAFVLANEQGLTMHVFDVAAVGVMRRICAGAELGTRISASASASAARHDLPGGCGWVNGRPTGLT
jgi:uridylate kinase